MPLDERGTQCLLGVGVGPGGVEVVAARFQIAVDHLTHLRDIDGIVAVPLEAHAAEPERTGDFRHVESHEIPFPEAMMPHYRGRKSVARENRRRQATPPPPCRTATPTRKTIRARNGSAHDDASLALPPPFASPSPAPNERAPAERTAQLELFFGYAVSATAPRRITLRYSAAAFASA